MAVTPGVGKGADSMQFQTTTYFRAVQKSGEGRSQWLAKGGFSLTEIMMSMLVLGMVVASTITALRSGFTMIQLARDNTMAAQILQSEMENLRMMGWGELNALEEEESFEIGMDFDSRIADRYHTVRRVTADNDRIGMMEVELEIQWVTTGGAEHNRVYRTLFSREGLNDYYYVTSR